MPRYPYYRRRYRRRFYKRRRFSYYPRRLYGRGSYASDIGRGLLEGGGGALGAAAGSLGGPVGTVVGGAVGAATGKGIADLVGWGSYGTGEVLDEGQPVPSFGEMAEGTRVRHREYLGTISIPGGDPTAFSNTSYPINPGLSVTFPWLYGMAQLYDQYQIHGMVFQFKSCATDAGAAANSLALGTVIMATDYNANDSAYTSLSQMLNSQFTCSGKPSQDIIHVVECDPVQNLYPIKQIRTGSIPSSRDAALYDHGVFQIATHGMPTGSSGQIGELWCSYDITLYKPSFSRTTIPQMDIFNFTTPAATDNYFGTSSTAHASNTIGGSVSGSTYTFPSILSSGRYLVHLYYLGASTALTNALAFNGTNIDTNVSLFPDPAQLHRVAAGVTSTSQHLTFIIDVTAANASFYISAGTLPGTITEANMMVCAIDNRLSEYS